MFIKFNFFILGQRKETLIFLPDPSGFAWTPLSYSLCALRIEDGIYANIPQTSCSGI